MSIRTILVGLLAAICGISATVAVNQFRKVVPTSEEASIVVARADINHGIKLTSDMLVEIPWPKTTLPSGSFESKSEVLGQYTTASFVKNEPMISDKVSVEPTFLEVPEGMRGVTIQTSTEAAMVAGLLVPGNRVDVIWTMTKKNGLLDGPLTMTLLENVEVLAVGQETGLPNRDLETSSKRKSVTILVTPELAEEINLAMELGTLNFSLRSSNSTEDDQPRRKLSISELVVSQRLEKASSEIEIQPDRMDVLAEGLADLKSFVVSSLADARGPQVEPKKNEAALVVIPEGMRAVAIQTPDDSSGVAGLIQPGNRVDVILTTQLLRLRVHKKLGVTTMTLLENVTVAAVGTKLQTNDSDAEPKLATSITLLVTPEMAQDINLGSEVGTLRLALRGNEEGLADGPRRMVNLAELINQSVAFAEADANKNLKTDEPDEKAIRNHAVIRVNQGGFNRDIPVHFTSSRSGDSTLAGVNAPK